MVATLSQLAGKRVHLLGIGGIGVSALARLLIPHGITVTGCDVRESTITRALREEGVEVAIGHDAAHVDSSDVIVYSTAVPKNNPELRAAQGSGKPVLHRSQLLALLVGAHDTVGVTGTNGKGTVCTMVTWMLEKAGLSPAFYIGGLCPNLGTNARETGARHMVAELDESDGSLLNIRPRYALVNNLELDHLNYYKDFDQVVATVHRFLAQLPDGSRAFLNADDPGVLQVARRLTGIPVTFFGRSPDADYRYEPVTVGDKESCFTVTAHGESLGTFELAVPGAYNIENAIGAIAVARELGVPVPAIAEALRTFCGLANRYTVLSCGRRRVIKDYMSHPSGMRKVLQTARLGRTDRLVAVFKPYRYTMINYHARNYADALALADEVVITEMWEAGEEPIPGVDTQWLVNQLGDAGLKVTYIREMEPIIGHLLERAGADDCVVFFGGNDLFEIAEQLHQQYRSLPDA